MTLHFYRQFKRFAKVDRGEFLLFCDVPRHLPRLKLLQCDLNACFLRNIKSFFTDPSNQIQITEKKPATYFSKNTLNACTSRFYLGFHGLKVPYYWACSRHWPYSTYCLPGERQSASSTRDWWHLSITLLHAKAYSNQNNPKSPHTPHNKDQVECRHNLCACTESIALCYYWWLPLRKMPIQAFFESPDSFRHEMGKLGRVTNYAKIIIKLWKNLCAQFVAGSSLAQYRI